MPHGGCSSLLVGLQIWGPDGGAGSAMQGKLQAGGRAEVVGGRGLLLGRHGGEGEGVVLGAAVPLELSPWRASVAQK